VVNIEFRQLYRREKKLPLLCTTGWMGPSGFADSLEKEKSVSNLRGVYHLSSGFQLATWTIN
jgi:hypothetical protein